MTRLAVNEYGLTVAEWIGAATLAKRRATTPEQGRAMRQAWLDGEDPTEWAAHWERTESE